MIEAGNTFRIKKIKKCFIIGKMILASWALMSTVNINHTTFFVCYLVNYELLTSILLVFLLNQFFNKPSNVFNSNFSSNPTQREVAFFFSELNPKIKTYQHAKLLIPRVWFLESSLTSYASKICAKTIPASISTILTF